METKKLTQTQELFLEYLRGTGTTRLSMSGIQRKYNHIASKASIKRDVDALVEDGTINREVMITSSPTGRITSIVIYSI